MNTNECRSKTNGRHPTGRLLLWRSSSKEHLSLFLSDLAEEEVPYQFGEESFLETIKRTFSITDHGTTCFIVTERASKEMVGIVRISISEDVPEEADIEFYIFREHRGKGYCQEAASMLIEGYFAGWFGNPGKLVTAETYAENEASITVLQHLGFKETGSGLRMTLDESNDEGQELRCAYGLKAFELEREDFTPYGSS